MVDFVNCHFNDDERRFTTCPLCRRMTWHDLDDNTRLGAHEAANGLPCPNGGELVVTLYPKERI